MNYSVVIRTKNSADTIFNCIESVLNQTIKPEKIVVVDSGSTDETLNIVSKLPVEIIHYPSNEKFNYSKSLNIGISRVSSEFILIMSSHVRLLNFDLMYWLLKKIAKSNFCKAISLNRSNSLYTSSITKIEDIAYQEIDVNNFNGRAMYNFCSIIRRDSWWAYQFNELIPRCEDQDWALYYLKKGFTTIIINQPYVYYENKYYNLKKDIMDYIVLAEFNIYPYFLSNKFIWTLLKKSKNLLLMGNLIGAKYNLRLAINLFIHKKIRKVKIKSVYNRKLE